MFIYKITNEVNGKIYIGQHKGSNLTQYLQKKFWAAKHRLSDRSHLYAAIRKHGRDAFTIEPLASVSDKAVLPDLETFCIAVFDSRNPEVGYNICRGGEGFTGPHSEETKAKMRERTISPENLAKLVVCAHARRGIPTGSARHTQPHSAESKLKNRNSHLGKPAWNKGKKMSEAYCLTSSLAHMGIGFGSKRGPYKKRIPKP
jgi:group I intron endonuclease